MSGSHTDGGSYRAGLGLQRLDTSACRGSCHFELHELNLGSMLMGHIALQALASGHSLKSLGLTSGLTRFNRI